MKKNAAQTYELLYYSDKYIFDTRESQYREPQRNGENRINAGCLGTKQEVQ